MKLELLAENLGFQQKEGAFSKQILGYKASLVMYKVPGSYVKIPMVIFVFSQTIDKEQTKKIAKASGLKGAIKESVALQDNAILTQARFGNKEKFDAYLEKLAETFKELGLKELDYCPYCGQTETDGIRVIKGAAVHVHDACVKDFVEKVTTHLDTVGTSKENLLKSILYAVVGGFVGLLPSIIILALVGFYSAWLFILIPFAAFYGFKKGGAQRGSYVMVIIALISFILAPGFMVYAYAEYAAAYNYTLAEAFEIAEFRAEFLTDLAMSVLFTAIAVSVSWKTIYKQTHGQIKKDIEELKG
jgi:hypothetical protein